MILFPFLVILSRYFLYIFLLYFSLKYRNTVSKWFIFLFLARLLRYYLFIFYCYFSIPRSIIEVFSINFLLFFFLILVKIPSSDAILVKIASSDSILVKMSSSDAIHVKISLSSPLFFYSSFIR